MSEYPKMLFAKGESSEPKLHGHHCQTCIVDSSEEERELLSGGWARTPAEAHGEMVASDDPEELNIVRDENAALLQERDELKAERDTAIKERDELKELMAAFDRDNNGKVGGSKPKEAAKA